MKHAFLPCLFRVLLCALFANVAAADVTPQSIALRIALNTGLTDIEKGPLFDTPRSALPEEFRGVSNHHALDNAIDATLLSTLGLLVVGGSYTAWARGGSVSPDLANLAFAGLSLLLHSPTQPHPATQPQVIAWLPAEPKGSRREERAARDAARAAMTAIMVEAAIAAMPAEVSVEMSDAYAHRAEHLVSGVEYCSKERGVRCRLGVGAMDPVRALSLDGEESWHWRNWQPGDKRNARTGVADLPTIWVVPLGQNAATENLRLTEERDYVARFSEHLPDGVFIYLPPAEGVPAAILNRRVLHFFIEPLD